MDISGPSLSVYSYLIFAFKIEGQFQSVFACCVMFKASESPARMLGGATEKLTHAHGKTVTVRVGAIVGY